MKDDMQIPPGTEDLDWVNLAETPLAIERGRIDAGEACCLVLVAGLQYHDYHAWDDILERRIMPAAGDRVSLMRRPENRADVNAVEIWWRDGHHFGYLPREIAAVIAPEMDAGVALRAYIVDPGDGCPWSVQVLLVGPACKPLLAPSPAPGA